MTSTRLLGHAELRSHANGWNDLWERSVVRRPAKRAEGIELWHRVFAAETQLMAATVFDGATLVAALPLIRKKLAPGFSLYRLPGDCTVDAGDLLIDPEAAADDVAAAIARQLAALPNGIIRFDTIELQSDRWQQLMTALRDQGRQLSVGRGHDVGVTDIYHDWEAYTKSWSRNHRKSINRARKKLEAEGTVVLDRLQTPDDETLMRTLETCFRIEDSTWKGEEGTSILKTPGLAEYFRQEAKMLRDLGMLDLWLLKVDGEVIAFEYCQFAKSTSFAHKVSFDPAWQRFSPGRVLQCMELQRYHDDPNATLQDSLGVLSESKASWSTRAYRAGRCWAAVGGVTSNGLLRAMNWVRQRRHNGETPTEPLPLGAARYAELARERSDAKAATAPISAIPVVEPSTPTAAG